MNLLSFLESVFLPTMDSLDLFESLFPLASFGYVFLSLSLGGVFSPPLIVPSPFVSVILSSSCESVFSFGPISPVVSGSIIPSVLFTSGLIESVLCSVLLPPVVSEFVFSFCSVKRTFSSEFSISA